MENLKIEWRKATPEEIQQGSSEMIKISEKNFDDGVSEIENEKINYIKRVVDGKDAFLNIVAELRLFSIDNNLPREVNKEIEQKLKQVRNEVVLGQWKTAREELDLVIVEGYLNQAFFDRIKKKLDDYIEENY